MFSYAAIFEDTGVQQGDGNHGVNEQFVDTRASEGNHGVSRRLIKIVMVLPESIRFDRERPG
jgi:hypothetical protein